MEMNHTINSCCDYDLHVRLLYSPARISSAKFTFKSPDLTWRSSAAGKHNITFMVKPLPLKNKTFHEYFPSDFTFLNHHVWEKLSNDVFCQSSPKLEILTVWLFPKQKVNCNWAVSFLPSVDFPSSTLTLPPSAITAKEPNTLKHRDINFKWKRKGFQHLCLLRFAEHT